MTRFCWFSRPVPRSPTWMLNARFSQNKLFSSNGYETCLQAPLFVELGWPSGHLMVRGKVVLRMAVFCMVTSPAGCGSVHTIVLPAEFVHDGGGVLARGAPIVLKSAPAEAVVS